jgi:phosphopantetheine--protein transferase-like protein
LSIPFFNFSQKIFYLFFSVFLSAFLCIYAVFVLNLSFKCCIIIFIKYGGASMLEICILSADKLCLDNDSDYGHIIDALPFGKTQCDRLQGIKNNPARTLSLTAWHSLSLLIEKNGYAKDDTSVERTDSGKPIFTSLPLYFSLSHTEGIACSALCDASVGIDIEWIDRERRIDAIAERFFIPEERYAIDSADDRYRAFFALWTKKEPFAKLTGKGLASVCYSTEYGSVNFEQYIIKQRDRVGILSLCHSGCERASIYDPYKEISIYELQN